MKNASFLPNFINFLFNRFMKGIGLFGTSFFYLIFLLFLFEINPSITIKSTIGFIIIEFLSAIIKIFFPKHRPIPGNHNTLLDKYEAGSFPSIHSARIAGLSILGNQLFPNNFLINCYLILLVILVSISRVYTKRHYWIDVIAGTTIGVLIMTIALNLTLTR